MYIYIVNDLISLLNFIYIWKADVFSHSAKEEKLNLINLPFHKSKRFRLQISPFLCWIIFCFK